MDQFWTNFDSPIDYYTVALPRVCAEVIVSAGEVMACAHDRIFSGR